jgi:hypothetical protein
MGRKSWTDASNEVCEKHNYVPRLNDFAYRASRKSIERIAKEGRGTDWVWWL